MSEFDNAKKKITETNSQGKSVWDERVNALHIPNPEVEKRIKEEQSSALTFLNSLGCRDLLLSLQDETWQIGDVETTQESCALRNIPTFHYVYEPEKLMAEYTDDIHQILDWESHVRKDGAHGSIKMKLAILWPSYHRGGEQRFGDDEWGYVPASVVWNLRSLAVTAFPYKSGHFVLFVESVYRSDRYGKPDHQFRGLWRTVTPPERDPKKKLIEFLTEDYETRKHYKWGKDTQVPYKSTVREDVSILKQKLEVDPDLNKSPHKDVEEVIQKLNERYNLGI